MSLEPSHRNQDSDREEPSDDHIQYRLRYFFGDFELFSEWRDQLTHVENLAEQLRRNSNFHDVTIEAKAEFRAHEEIAVPGEAASSPEEAYRTFGEPEGQR